MKKFFPVAFSVFFLLFSCELFTNLTDTIAPDPVTSLSAEDNVDSVVLSWTTSFSADVKNLEISWTGQTDPILESNDITSYTVDDLAPGTAATFTIVVVDQAGNRSTPAEVEVELGGFAASQILYYEDFEGATWDDTAWAFRAASPVPSLQNGLLEISSGVLMHYGTVLGANAGAGIFARFVTEDTNTDDNLGSTAFEFAEPTSNPDLVNEQHEIFAFFSNGGVFVRVAGGAAAPNLTTIGTYARGTTGADAGEEIVRIEWTAAGMAYYLDGNLVGNAAMGDLVGGFWADPPGTFDESGGYIPSYTGGFRFLLNHFMPDKSYLDFILIYEP